jgi:hypothetical protein
MSGDGVILIPVNPGKFALIDEASCAQVDRYKWFLHSAGYAQAYCPDTYRLAGGKNAKSKSAGHILMHRLITAAPKGFVVDHINGDILDNRAANLRVCSQSENMKNGSGHADRRGKYRGVTSHGNGFIVMLRGYVGFRKNETDAAELWDATARSLGMDERHMNFPRRH